MRLLVSSESRIKHLASVLDDPGHPHYMAAYKMAAAYGYGMPTQAHEHTGKDGEPIAHEVSVVDIRAKIAGRIAGLGTRITSTADLGGAVSSRVAGT